MKITKVVCDVCGSEVPYHVPVVIVKAREPDPSGNGFQEDRKHYDVCHSCVNRMATRLSMLSMFPELGKVNR